MEDHAEKGGQKKREHAVPVQQKRGERRDSTEDFEPRPGEPYKHTRYVYAVMGFPFWAVLKEH